MTFKNNKIAAITKNIRIEDKAVASEMTKVIVEIHTKDGKVRKQTILGNEIRRTLSMYQTFGNCVGFPAARDADFATVRSALNRPTKLMTDYLAGKLDRFFMSTYSRPNWDTKGKREYLTLNLGWENDMTYYVGKNRARYELDLTICTYLYAQNNNK